MITAPTRSPRPRLCALGSTERPVAPLADDQRVVVGRLGVDERLADSTPAVERQEGRGSVGIPPRAVTDMLLRVLRLTAARRRSTRTKRSSRSQKPIPPAPTRAACRAGHTTPERRRRDVRCRSPRPLAARPRARARDRSCRTAGPTLRSRARSSRADDRAPGAARRCRTSPRVRDRAQDALRPQPRAPVLVATVPGTTPRCRPAHLHRRRRCFL